MFIIPKDKNLKIKPYLQKRRSEKRNPFITTGFTLIELLLYVGITAIIAGSMFGIFNTVTKTGLQQSASNEASTQLNFVMQTVQNLVKSSSLIETETLTGVATSTLKLRMQASSKDPTCISLVDGAIKLAEGPDENNKQNCTSTLSNLTDNNVVVDQLDFKKFSQYPGHDVVSLNIQITSSSTNPTSRVTRNLQASIARVSAATFDSDLIPGSDNTWSVGFSPTRWKDAAFSGNLFVEGNVGIGTTTAATLFSVATSTNIFNVLSSGFVGVGTTTPASVFGVFGTSTFMGGNVGIGTTAPGAKLDVAGQIKITGGTPGANKVLTSDADGLATWQTPATTGYPSVAGETLFISADTERTISSTSYVKIKEISSGNSGTFTIRFDLNGVLATSSGRIYRNDVAVGTEQSQEAAYSTKTENISGWAIGDLIQLYVKRDSANGVTKNFRIYGHDQGFVVNTD